MAVDVKFLLDGVALVGEVRILPREVVHVVERQCLKPSVARAEKCYVMIDCRVDHSGPANEATGRKKVLVDTRDRVVEAESLSISIEGGRPQRRGGNAMGKKIVTSAAASG